MGKSIFFPYSQKEIITIEAITTTNKKKPENPGGIKLAGAKNIVYDNISKYKLSNHKINLTEPPEEPTQITHKQELVHTDFFDSIDNILANLSKYEDINSNNAQEENEPIDEKLVLPNNRTSTKNTLEPKQESIQTINGLQIIEAPASVKKLTKINSTLARSSGYLIQLEIATSEQKAFKKWTKLNSKYPSVLSKSELIIRKIMHENNKFYFLVLAGTYSSKSAANNACRKLQSANQHCVVIKAD